MSGPPSLDDPPIRHKFNVASNDQSPEHPESAARFRVNFSRHAGEEREASKSRSRAPKRARQGNVKPQLVRPSGTNAPSSRRHLGSQEPKRRI